MKESILRDKSYAFAIRIVNLYRYLCDEQKEYVLSKQITSLGNRNRCTGKRSRVWSVKGRFYEQNEYRLKRSKRNELLAQPSKRHPILERKNVSQHFGRLHGTNKIISRNRQNSKKENMNKWK